MGSIPPNEFYYCKRPKNVRLSMSLVISIDLMPVYITLGLQLIHKNSFIHIEHLYSASSRKLLRSTPNTSTVKQSSLKVRKKRRRSGSVKNAKFRREAVPG